MEFDDQADSSFSADEWLRYARHFQLPLVGTIGQTKLKQSHVLIIGAGGLGSPVSLYLAAAGVGKITIVDNDEIELSNLQRQILYKRADLGLNKASVAQEALKGLNEKICVEGISDLFSSDNAETLVRKADIVLDCTDNFETRYLINATCRKLQKPWIYASIHQFSGQMALFHSDGPCFECLFPEPDTRSADCNTAGVLGVLPGILGSLQASEALKFLCGLEPTIKDELLLFDALKLNMQKIKMTQSPGCSCCDSKPSGSEKVRDKSTIANTEPTAAKCGLKNHWLELSVDSYLKTFTEAQHSLLDVRSPEEHAAFNLSMTSMESYDVLPKAQSHKAIPVDILEEQLGSLNRNSTLICYCQTGARSLKAAEKLNELGYSAQSIKGGLAALLKHIVN